MSKAESRTVVVAAPDRPTASHAVGVLEASGVAPTSVFAGERGWVKRAFETVEGAKRPILMLVPSAKLGRAQLDLVERSVGAGGTALVWSALPAPDASDAESLVTERLLEQRGALTDPRPRVLAEAARVLCHAGAVRLAGVHLPRQTSAVGTRLKAALELGKARLARRRGKETGSLSIDKRGAIKLRIGASPPVPLSDAETAARALALLTSRVTVDESRPAPDVEPDQEVVNLIARPPARLLSETTSKRLLAAFGVEPGPERLCGSATEAARFWAEIGGPAVIKLVRPGLESKAEQDAVITGVEGAAAVRRAYHSLRALAETLGPPDPLGVLVAAQISGGARIWLALEDHPRFGRLVVGGTGDESISGPSIALTAPVSSIAALTALERSGVEADPDAMNGLADAIVGFGRLGHDLGDRITRAEVHPLVVPEGGDRAMALDGLIAISS